MEGFPWLLSRSTSWHSLVLHPMWLQRHRLLLSKSVSHRGVARRGGGGIQNCWRNLWSFYITLYLFFTSLKNWESYDQLTFRKFDNLRTFIACSTIGVCSAFFRQSWSDIPIYSIATPRFHGLVFLLQTTGIFVYRFMDIVKGTW